MYGSMLRDALVDEEADLNVITIMTIRNTCLEIESSLSIIWKVANKRIYKPHGMISNVCVNV